MSLGEILSGRPTLRLLPTENVSEDDILGVGMDNDWQLVRVIAKTADHPAETIWKAVDGKTLIHWIDDPKINLCYVAVIGENLDEVAGVIRSEVPTWTLEQVSDMAKGAVSRVEKMRAVYYLALLAPDSFDETLFRLFGAFFRDEDAEVRGAAVLAISYVGWSQFLEPLQTLASSDDDASVRQDARTLIENIKKYPARSTVVT